MSEPRDDNEVGCEVADLTPIDPCAADLLRIRLEAEVIREEWRERDDETAQRTE